MTTLDEFTTAYIACALWSSTDNSRDDGGDPLDQNYGPEDIAPSTLRVMQTDCREFHENYQHLFDDDAQAGHDFWLTRNGHGAGFWDGDWPEPAATVLTNGSKWFGEFDLTVGDDGLIHH